MVFFAQRPRFDSALAQIAREFSGKSVEREDALGLYKIDIAKEIVVIGVIGERKDRVDLITVNCIRIDRPATDHRHAFPRNFLDHRRMAGARRTDQHFSGDVVFVVTNVFAKRLAELLVNARHLIDRAVQHRSETCSIERAQNFLCFA